MKRNLFPRIFAVLMIAVMLVGSCMSISAMSVSAPGGAVSEDENYYVVSFEDGVLTVKLNPDKIYGLIKDGNLSRADLLNFIPADVLDTIVNADDLSVDELIDIVARYVTVNDLKELVDLIPVDVLRKYFSLDMLTKIFTIEEIVSLIPMDEIFETVDEDELELILSDELIDIALNDEVKEAVFTDEFMTKLLGNEAFIADVKSNHYIAERFDDYINNEEAVAAMLDNEAFVDAVFTPALAAKVFTMDTVSELVSGGYITATSDYAEIKAAVLANAEAKMIVARAVVKSDVTVDEIAAACGGYTKLLDVIVPEDMVKIVGVHTLREHVREKELIISIGGFAKLFSMYTVEDVNAMIDAIGLDEFKDFVANSGIAEALHVRNIARDAIELLRTKSTEMRDLVATLGKNALTFLLTDVNGIYINDTQVYKAGSFDLDKIAFATVQAIPRVNDFMELSADDIVASYKISADIGGKTYGFGIEFGFLGDPTNLQNAVKKLADNFTLSMTDDGTVNLMVVTPEVVSDIYKNLLESDKISATVKDKILEMPMMTVAEVRDFFAGLDEDQMADVVVALGEKLEQIKEDAYARIESQLPESGTLEELADVVASSKAVVDRMLKAFTTVDNFKALRSKIISTIDALPVVVQNTQLIEFYNGAGNFAVSGSASIDVLSLITKVVALPDEAKLLFTSTVLSYNINADVTLKGVNELTLVSADGTEFKTLLPEGISLDVLKNVNSVDYAEVDYYTVDEETLSVMPDKDVTLYSKALYKAKFMAPDGKQIGDTVFYAPGATSIDAPAIPDEYNKAGYTVAWSDYELNAGVEIKVDLEYTPIVYTATFVADGKVVGTDTFTVEDTALDLPEVPAKEGYDGKWGEYTIGAGDITVEAVYTLSPIYNINYHNVANATNGNPDKYNANELPFALIDATKAHYRFLGWYTDAALTNKVTEIAKGTTGVIDLYAKWEAVEYTVTFKGHGSDIVRKFTADNMSVTAPEVPAKAGYTGKWETYTLELKNMVVNAVYTAIEYEATFVADDKVVGTDKFTVEDSALNLPAVPAKTGYTGAWESYTIGAGNITVKAVYTPVQYTATFTADGKEVGKVTFTVEDKTITAPEVPAKVGYTGKWEAYTLEAKDITVKAVYTANVYTATFMADGKEVGKVQFTVEDMSIAEPSVPAKDGFLGKWESYELKAEDITINAVYTPVVEGDDDGGFYWWWIIIIIALIIVAIIIYFIFKSKNPPADPEPEPEPEPAPVVEPEPEPTPIVIPVIEEVEDIAPEEADELMSDDVALAGVIVDNDEEPTEGMRDIINIGDINDHFVDGDTVNLAVLQEKKLVSAKAKRLKVLADGHLNKHHLTVEAHSFSVQAIKMIQLTGGTVIQKK